MLITKRKHERLMKAQALTIAVALEYLVHSKQLDLDDLLQRLTDSKLMLEWYHGLAEGELDEVRRIIASIRLTVIATQSLFAEWPELPDLPR